ncbi:capsule synthesis protein PGA_cap [Kineococcus xinjiangensis]|uniref:Capsule synthesis protein PGA_cap n=1 Tax=Kineococcus xinjiangensis TaxID=512762 RepID=A0A2S6IKH3_9ACTN|nr:capsule synthesis protein PGA_cap [Kineococcus xinjiangensis]
MRGQRIAVLAATQVLDSSLAAAWTAEEDEPGLASAQQGRARTRLLQAVREARASADSVLVLLHWGRESRRRPLPVQRSLADELIAAGVDAVVGSQAHALLGAGWKHSGGRSGYVDYGLGNFVSYSRRAPATSTGVLELTLGADGSVSAARWHPAVIRSGVPVPLTGEDAWAAAGAKESLRRLTDLHPTPGGAATTS